MDRLFNEIFSDKNKIKLIKNQAENIYQKAKSQTDKDKFAKILAAGFIKIYYELKKIGD